MEGLLTKKSTLFNVRANIAMKGQFQLYTPIKEFNNAFIMAGYLT